jgi:galactonate dehydratase
VGRLEPQNTMPKITEIEWFRVPPRWLFVKIVDDAGNVGWGEATLEGHTQAVEGALDAFKVQFLGFDAECVIESRKFLFRSMLTFSNSEIERIWQHGYRRGFYRGGPVLMSALSGIDIALWDLKGKTSSLQISQDTS